MTASPRTPGSSGTSLVTPVPPATTRRRESSSTVGALLALGSVVAGAVNYLLTVSLTHRLVPADYASYSGAQGVLTINGMVGGAGISWVVAQIITREPGPRGLREAVTFGTWANLALGVVSGAVSAAVVATFAGWGAATVLGLTIGVLAVGSTVFGVLQGQGRTGVLGGALALEAVVKAAVAMVLVTITAWGTVGALAGSLVGVTIFLVAYIPLLPHLGPVRGVVRTRSLWVSALRFTLLQGVVSGLSTLDVVVAVALTDDPSRAALYQAASTLGRSLLFVAGAIATTVFTRLGGPDDERRRAQALRSYALVWACAAALLLTLPRAVLLRFFPPAYAGLLHWIPATTVLGGSLGVLCLLMTFLQSRTHARRHAIAVGAAVVVVVVTTTTATLAWGLAGTAVGAAGSMALAAAGLASMPEQRGAFVLAARDLATGRVVVTAAAAVGLLLFARPHAPAWTVAAITLVIGTGAWAFPEVRAAVSSRSRVRRPSPVTATSPTSPPAAPAIDRPQEMP